MKVYDVLRRNALTVALSVMVIVTLLVSIKSLLLTKVPDPASGVSNTYYNNYLIFKHSFYHLLDNKDLYLHYPQEYYDLYKYSPTFALLMAPFSALPEGTGLLLWNLLNSLVLFIAFWKFPSFSPKQKLFSLLLLLIELITSLQNNQSNALMAGLILLAFIFMEKDRPWISILFVVLTAYIKIFGLVAFVMYIFYPKRLKTALIALFWTVILFLLPLLVVTPAELIGQYKNWVHLLQTDHSTFQGYSIMGWLYSWFGLQLNKNLVVGVGAVLLMLPLIQIKKWKALDFRILMLASLLIWMVIFNHMAESPTFIIAVSGVAIWFFTKEKKPWYDILFLALVFLFTILSPTDLFPASIREEIVKPYVLKAVPCIFVWIRMQFELFAKP